MAKKTFEQFSLDNIAEVEETMANRMRTQGWDNADAVYMASMMAPAVLRDVYECADPEAWTDVDVDIAFRRTLLKLAEEKIRLKSFDTFSYGPNEIAYKHMMSKAHEEEERAAHAGQTRMYTATSVSYDPDDGHTACVQTIVSRTEQGALDWIGEAIYDTICCLPVFAESLKTGCGDKGMWRTNLSTGGLSGEPLLQGYLVAEMLMTDTDMNPIRTQFFIDDCWV